MSHIIRTLISTFRQRGVQGTRALLRYYVLRALAAVVGPGRECPACGWRGREFVPLYAPEYLVVRPRAVCPRCGAAERHRAYARWYPSFLRQHFQSPSIVHFAPEESLEPVLKRPASRYRKSNYATVAPDEIQLDICNLDLPSGSEDLFVLNHVACCLPDEREGVRHLYRALRPGGMAIVGENLRLGERTMDFPARGYGGAFRQYGTVALAERFAPFEVAVEEATAGLTDADLERFGIPKREYAIVLRKSGGPVAESGRTPQ